MSNARDELLDLLSGGHSDHDCAYWLYKNGYQLRTLMGFCEALAMGQYEASETTRDGARKTARPLFEVYEDDAVASSGGTGEKNT